MKNIDLYNLLGGLKVLANESGASFAYKVAKNIKLITSELMDLEEMLVPKEDYSQYDRDRVELCKKFSKKDALGVEIISDSNYQIEDLEKFNEELAALQKRNTDTIARYSKQKEDYSTLMQQEISPELNLRQIKLEELPESVTPEKLQLILELITE